MSMTDEDRPTTAGQKDDRQPPPTTTTDEENRRGRLMMTTADDEDRPNFTSKFSALVQSWKTTASDEDDRQR